MKFVKKICIFVAKRNINMGFLSMLFKKDDWILIESHTGKWTHKSYNER